MYQAVFWVKADNPLSLSTDFIEIAKLLNLPQKEAQESEDAIRAVKSWLEATPGWLLILDSADEPDWFKAYLPRQVQGHILLTSRAQDFQMLYQFVELELHIPRADPPQSPLLRGKPQAGDLDL